MMEDLYLKNLIFNICDTGNQGCHYSMAQLRGTPIIVSVTAVHFGVVAADNTFNYKMSPPSQCLCYLPRPLEALSLRILV